MNKVYKKSLLELLASQEHEVQAFSYELEQENEKFIDKRKQKRDQGHELKNGK